MPASIKLQEEYGEDLAVLFVESQGTAPGATTKFVLEHKWLGNEAMWTNESPFRTGSNGLPNFALLSADGKVLSKGNFVSKRVREQIEAEIKRGKLGPSDTPKKLKKAWKSFAKGDVSKAVETAKKVGQDAELSADAELAVLAFIERSESRLERINWLIDNGYASRAESLLKAALKNFKGSSELYDRATEIQVSLDSDEGKREIKASALLEKRLKKLYGDPKNEKLFKKIAKLAEEFTGTKAGERARSMAALGS
ncbi:MAG: hypothetical protein ABGY71_14355 [bacterium]|nr:hypothetical protein [Planctomycetota bacterium]HIL52519.1 hypothetical protein [Planctomycetota bacterium]